MIKVEFNKKFNPVSFSHVLPTVNESLAGGYNPTSYFRKRRDDNQEERPEAEGRTVPMWDAISGTKKEMNGLRGSSNINSDEQIGYMKATGEWRVKQPSGGSNPRSYQAPAGINPNEVRGVGQSELPQQFDFDTLQKLAMQVGQQQGSPEMERIVYDHQKPEGQGAPTEIAPGMGGVSQKMSDTHNKMFTLGGSKEEYMMQQRMMQMIMMKMMQMMGGGNPPGGGGPPPPPINQ